MQNIQFTFVYSLNKYKEMKQTASLFPEFNDTYQLFQII